jgi:fatty-acyl-CoA synthase
MVSPQLVLAAKEAFGCVIQTIYGQTECSPIATMHRHDETLEDCCNTVGQALPQTEIAILSIEDGNIQPLGQGGEICLRGYGCMIEYNDNPEATAAAVDAEGWLHTGDLGTMDARGYLSVTGRVKEMIIRGGENLFPAEIENTLLAHPEVAVVGVPDQKWGEIVATFVRPSDGCDLDAAKLKAHCRAHLAPMKTPVIWAQLDTFPLTGSGKIRKLALREMLLSGEIKAIQNV